MQFTICNVPDSWRLKNVTVQTYTYSKYIYSIYNILYIYIHTYIFIYFKRRAFILLEFLYISTLKGVTFTGLYKYWSFSQFKRPFTGGRGKKSSIYQIYNVIVVKTLIHHNQQSKFQIDSVLLAFLKVSWTRGFLMFSGGITR